MKTTLIGLLILLFAQTVIAEDVVLSYSQPAPPYGTYDIMVTDAHEVAKEPERLTVAIHCLDRRAHRGTTLPTTVYWYQNQPICDFRPHITQGANEYDQDSATLTIHYSVMTKQGNTFSCGSNRLHSNKAEPLYIDQLCAKYQ